MIVPNNYENLDKFVIQPSVEGNYIFDVVVYEDNNINDGNTNRKDSTSITVVVKSSIYPQVSITSSIISC